MTFRVFTFEILAVWFLFELFHACRPFTVWLDTCTKTIHEAVWKLASCRVGLSTDDLLGYESLLILLFLVLKYQILVERVTPIDILVCLEQLELTLEGTRKIPQ